MTDFCLIYRENGIKVYFYGEGIWDVNTLVGYEVKTPEVLKVSEINPLYFSKRDLIINRLKEYIKSKEFKWHSNVSVENM